MRRNGIAQLVASRDLFGGLGRGVFGILPGEGRTLAGTSAGVAAKSLDPDVGGTRNLPPLYSSRPTTLVEGTPGSHRQGQYTE